MSNNSNNISPAPPGAYVELDATLIDEGKYIAMLTARLKQAYADLVQYEKESFDRKAKAVVTAKITLHRTPNTEDCFDIDYDVSIKVPTIKRSSVAKESKDGKLICQPAGTNQESPDQQLFYDNRGRIIGGPKVAPLGDVDEETGEEKSRHVAGRIEPRNVRQA
jgi:hypothetical protein